MFSAHLFLILRHGRFVLYFFFFNDTATTEIYTLSLHDALPVSVLLGSSTAPAATDGAGTTNAGHKCLVMTGSGDPAFTKNFNPYAGGGLPTNAIAQGAFYEPLLVVPAGGNKTVPWLARR